MWLQSLAKSLHHQHISTHTSRVGCDSRMQLGFSCIFISTHTSRVGCDAENISKKEDMEFLLTHPVWDVTFPVPRHVGARLNFYSHIPCGMWHHVHGFSFHFLLFLLTHPVWDVTPFLYIISINPINFYSHIPCGMWLLGSLFYANDYLFLLTHPVWDVTMSTVSLNRGS